MNYTVVLISIFNSLGFKPQAIENVMSPFNSGYKQKKPPHFYETVSIFFIDTLFFPGILPSVAKVVTIFKAISFLASKTIHCTPKAHC